MLKTKTIFYLTLVLGGGLFGCLSSSTNWRTKAATVVVGMTRAEVDEILPEWTRTRSETDISGGRVSTIGGSGAAECYWVSEHQRVVVIFNSVGGSHSMSNRVTSPVKVYESDYGTAFGTTNGTTYGTSYRTNWTIHEP